MGCFGCKTWRAALPRAVVGVGMFGVPGRDEGPPSFRMVGVDGRDDRTSSGRNLSQVCQPLERAQQSLGHTFGGSGLFSLAALIALMLFMAESGNGALASHSSTPIVGLTGVGAGSCAWFRRGGARVEVIFKMILGRRFGYPAGNAERGSTRNLFYLRLRG